MRKLQIVLAFLMIFSMILASCTTPQAQQTTAPEAEETTAPEAEEPAAPEETTAPEAEEPAAPEETTAPEAEEPAVPATQQQAPMLQEMVDAGELPPLEERLPVTEDIMVVEPVAGIGEYGGRWEAVTGDPGAGNIKMKLYDPPVRWKRDYTGYEPGLAKSYEWSEDGKTITFHLRQGVKWSDGEPYTTADLKFWWEDLAQNEDYKVINVPWWARNTDGTPITMEFPDEYTWVLTFDQAQWIMPYVLAQGFWEWEPLMKPKHFLEQFHPTYNTDAAYEDLQLNDSFTQTPGYPCLMAWCLKEYDAGKTWLFSRNPYYWKTDPEGNQLPYIDELHVELVQDPETRSLRVTQGSYDCSFRGIEDPTNIPFLTEQAEAGDYRIVPGWMNGAGAWPGWIINMDYHEDEEYDEATETDQSRETRELIRTKEFRKGLSIALDRQRIVDVVWEGIGTPQNFTISPQSWHFASPEGKAIFEEWAAIDTEYDPEGAKALFDSIGFVDATGDGYRDLPSGKEFTLIIDHTDWGGERVTTAANEVYVANLEDVGVKSLLNYVVGQPESSLRANYGWGYMLRNAHASEIDLWTYPDWVFPLRGQGEGSRAFPVQGYYYQSGGEGGWQPEEGSAAARLQEIYRRGLQEPDEEARHQLIYEAIRVYIEEGPFVIGGAGDQPMPVVCKNNFMNVPEYGVLGPWAPGSPGNVNPEQFWIDE